MNESLHSLASGDESGTDLEMAELQKNVSDEEEVKGEIEESKGG